MSIVKEKVTMTMVKKFIKDVAKHYKDANVSGVYGIPRGGMILAVYLSYKMNIPLLLAPYENCIIIDDISDSGETLKHYRYNSSGQESHKYHIVTMYYNESSAVKPDYFRYYKTDKWIVYPWEE